MINICTFDNRFQSRILGWCCSLLLLFGSLNVSFSQIPSCAPGTGNTLTGPVGPDVFGFLSPGCTIAGVPDLRPRWTATPGAGWVVLTVNQGPPPGMMLTIPKGSACANVDVPVNIVALFYFEGDPFTLADDLFCELSGIDLFHIRDIQAPTIVSPLNKTLNVGPGCTVTAAQILATVLATEVDDNCTNDATLLANLVLLSPVPVLSCPPAPNTFALSIRTTDACGNPSNIATLNLTLQDLVAPTVTCIPNQLRFFDGNCQYQEEDFRGTVTAMDVCGAPLSVSQRIIAPVVLDLFDPLNPSFISGAGCPSLKSVTVRMCVQDCFGNGNLDPSPVGPIPSNCCTFQISIRDNTPPDPVPANCPGGPIPLITDINCMVVIPDLRTTDLFVDNCDPILDPTLIRQTPPPGPFDASSLICTPFNTIDITFSYTDCNNNGPATMTCDDVLQVFDFLPPHNIICPAAPPFINLAIDPVTCQYTVATVPIDFFNGIAVGVDNCDPNPIEHNDQYIFDCHQLGLQPITVTAEDCNGLISAPFVCNVLVRANPADAGWTNPGKVCLNQLPLNLCLFITGVTCGEWSGDQVTTGNCASGGGIFNPSVPGAYAVTYTVGDADCHVELTRVINVEQAVAPPFLINDFSVCLCPDAIIDLETFLLGSAPQGGSWIINNPGGLQFNLLPPPGPGNSHAARYDDGCGTSQIIYSYTDCTNTVKRDTINVTIRRCAEVEADGQRIACQGDIASVTLYDLKGCADYNVSISSAILPGSPLNFPLGSAPGFVLLNTNSAAGGYSWQVTVTDPTGVCTPKQANGVIQIYQKAASPNGINPVGPVCETVTFPLNLSLINPNDLAGLPLTAANVRWFGGGVTDNGTTGLFTPNDSDGDGIPGPGNYTVCVNVGDPKCEETYCINIIINNHVFGTCTLDEYRACLDPGATVTFSDLLQSAAISGGHYIITGITNNGAFSTNVAVGDTVTGLVYNGGCGVVNYQHVITSCPTNIVCNGTIIINQAVHIDISGPQIFCANDPGPYLIRNNGTTSACGLNGGFSKAGPGLVDGNNGVTANFYPALAGEGLHRIIYAVGNDTPGGPNCRQSDTLDIIVYAASDPSFNLPINTCADVTSIPLVLSNPDPSVNPGPDGVAEVVWSGNGVTDGTGGDPTGTFNPSVAGPGYHLICVMTGEGSCMKFNCKLIRVHAVNNATLIADQARGCYNFNKGSGGIFIDFDLDEFLTPATTRGGAWSLISGPPIGPGASIRNHTLIGIPGCHQLRYTVSEAYPGALGGCGTQTDDIFLVLLESPDPSFDLAEEVCWNGIPGSLTLLTDYTGTTSGNNGTRTYSWTSTLVSGAGPVPTFNNNTVQEPSVTIQGPGVFELCMTETITYAACGAVGSQSCNRQYCERITVHQTNTEVNPTWTRPNPFRFCTTDGCIDLDALVVSGGGTQNGVFTGQGVQLDPSHPNYRFCPAVAGPGIHPITYTVQNGAGCTAVMTHNIEVYAPPVNNCPNDSLVLSCATKRLGATSFGPLTANGVTFYITSNYKMGSIDLSSLLCPAATDGGIWTMVTSPPNSLGAGATGVILGDALLYTDPGCYTVTYTVSSFPGAPAGCVVARNYRILIGEQPMPMMDLPDQICWAVGVPTITLDIPANYNTSPAAHSGTFVTTDYSSNNTGVATVTPTTGIVTIVGAGTVKICMRQTYMNTSCTPSLTTTCQGEVCETITVTQTNTASNPAWTGFGPICVDAACVNLTALVTGTPGGVFSGQGVVLNTAHPNYQFCPAIAGVGTHAITYTVQSPDGCTNVLTRNIVVAPLADATLVNKQLSCLVEPGGVIPLSVLFAGPNTTAGGTWSFSNTPPGGAQIMGGNLIFTQAGCYCFTYTVATVPGATSGGCFAQGSACLQISEQPTPSFSVQNEICWSTNDPVTTFTPLVNSPSYDPAGTVSRTWASNAPAGTITLNASTGAFTINGPVPLGGLIFDLCMTENITTPICGPSTGPNPATPGNPQVICTEQFCERISIRDGTLLNATFTANPANPCLGQTVTLTPVVGGGTFTGLGVTNPNPGVSGQFVTNVCGVYAVTYTLDDPNGCSNSYTLNIYTDTVKPTLNLPAPITVNCQATPTTTMAAWAATASGSDNCTQGATVTNVVFDRQSSCSPGTGRYVFMFTATDACGNTRTGFSSYTVQDTTRPAITGGANLVVECGNDVYGVVYAWLNSHAGTTGTDACDPSAFLTWSNNFNGIINNYCGAPVPVTFFVQDRCGNSNNVTFTLQVRDLTPPIWNIRPQNLTLECDGTTDPYAAIASWLGAVGNGVAIDSCQKTVFYSNNYTGLTPGCSRFTGSSLVTFTARDACGNATSAQATVSVVDRFPPDITSPAKDTVVECDGLGNRNALATWILNHGGARAIDRCGRNGTSPGILRWDAVVMRTENTCGVNDIFTYMFTAIDSCNNVSAATIARFIIKDTTPPIWSSDPLSTTAQCDGKGNIAQLNAWIASNGGGSIAADPCNGTVRIEHDQVREYDRCSNTDSTVYRFTAYDCSGNSSTREASFIIIDNVPPTLVSAARDTTISCENLSGNNDDELLGWLNYRAGFNTTDACSDQITYTNDYQAANWVRLCGPSRFVVVTFSATDDCGNVTRSSARFTITDLVRPRFLNCPPPIVQNAEADHCDAYVTVPKLVATDNCTQADSIVISQIYGPNPVQYRFPVGTTILKYEARDLCGNRDTCTIKVVVNDYWDVPAITCPANVDTTNSAGVCGRNNLGGLAPTLVRDICPHTAVTYVIKNETGDTIKKGIVNASGSNFPKGLNQVCYTVQDQPILLITEVTQQIDAAIVGSTSPIPAFISPADQLGDYIEVTNFGPSAIDISCLSMKIFEGGRQVGVYTLPSMILSGGNMVPLILPAGRVLTLHVGAAIPGFPDNPAQFFFNMNLPEAVINTPRGYVLNHLDLRNIDVVTTNGYVITGQGIPAVTAADWGGVSATNLDRGSYYRRCIVDNNQAYDWLLAEGCEPATIGSVNPILAPFVFPANGLTTSVQTINAQKASCCFNVRVRDTETPMCATNDTLVINGATGVQSGPGCYRFNLNVPASPATKIIDVWVTNLSLNISNFANSEGTLIHPDGTRVRLWNDGTCNLSTAFSSARISDLDAIKIRNAACGTLGSALNYMPDQPLSVLCPKSAAGTWVLEIENNTPPTSSLTVNGWQLTIISQRAYAQRDTIINNDLNTCGANFTWVHPVVMDNCCMGTVDVQYIPVPMAGFKLPKVPTGGRVNPGTRTTQNFGVGMTRVVYTLTDMSGNTGTCEFKITVRDAQFPVFANCPKDYTINLPGGDCFAFLEINPALNLLDNCDTTRIVVNPPLNTQLGIGVHTIVATGNDGAGNTVTCTWRITVSENNPTGRDLACVDEINFSLGPDCRGTLTADELLSGINYGCKDKYVIIIEDWITGQIHSNLFTTADIGRHFKVTVIDPVTGNKCWSKVFIEYKATPAINCPRDTVVYCNSPLDPQYLGNPVITSCVFNYDIHYDDTIQKARDCDFPIAFIIKRTFTVTNELGNGSQCTQIISVRGFDLSAIEWPHSYDNLDYPALNCDEKRYDKDVTPHILPSPYCVDGYLLDSAYWYATGGDPTIVDPFTRDLSGDRIPKLLGWNYLEGGINDGHPSPYGIYYDAHPSWRTSGACWGPNQVYMWQGTGAPSLGGIPLNKDNKYCNLSIRYDDEVYDICANGYEILRYWKVRNMCLPPLAGVNPVEYIQVIKVLDQEGPQIAYPDTVVVGTNSLSCYGTWDVPFPWITDNCSDSVSYTVRTWTGNAIQQLDGSWIVINMKLGVYPIVITAQDACGNKTEKVIHVNVIDNTPPTAVCDKNIVVGITGNQSAGNNFGKIYAEDINDGSFDNCKPHIFFKAIRMEQLRNTNNGSNVAQPDNGTNCAGINGDDNSILDGNQIYFDDYINFCCSDAGKTIMVVMRVFDVDPGPGPISPSRMNQNGNLFGHYNDCMIEITVQDKGVPTVVPPPNIVVSCWYWFDVDKLTDPNDASFGRVVTDLGDRHKVVTNDLVCYNYCVRNDITGYPGYVPGAPPSNPPAWNKACDYYRTLFDTAHYDRKYELVWGFDGYVLSNCGNTPTISVNDNRECGQGQITRTVVARGPNGISVTATQTIWVVDCDPFYINGADDCDTDDDITWPGNCTGQATTIDGCGADISPDNPLLGRPVIENNADDLCSLISIEYFDEIFTIEPDACFKILRTWVVIDWCQYDPNIDPTKGRWEYLQIIKVHDNDKPIIVINVGDCEPAVKNATDNICYGHLSLTADATDNCSPLDWLFYDYKIDLFNDGKGQYSGFDVKSGPLTRKEFAAGVQPKFHDNPYADDENNPFDASGTYPVGTHRICWYVEDGCGNIAAKCQVFDIKDCKAPTPYCLTGVITVPMPTTGCITVWAKDLDRGSFDNCTNADNLKFYFDGDPAATSKTICCDDFVAAGANDELFVEVQMWVEDEEGNTDYCKTTIIVQDNQDICPNSIVPGRITGLLKTETGSETEFSDVQMYESQLMKKQMTTHSDGKYFFGDLAYGPTMEYIVRPFRNDNPTNGVTTADIVKIQRHILGIETLNSPYKLIAADVNASATITAADVSEIRKLILGVNAKFTKPGVESWTFVPVAYAFINPTAPWNAPREAVIPMPNQGTHNEDFVAIKMADVTNSAIAHNVTSTTSRHNDQLHFEVEDGTLKAGEVYEVEFKSSNFNDIAGYQFTLKFDQEAVFFEGLEAGALNVTEANFGLNYIKEGMITTSWNSEKGLSFDKNEVLFTLRFRAMKDVAVGELMTINSNVTLAEAYNSTLDIKDVDLGVRTDKGVVETGVFELYQNAPNPFDKETVISFRLPSAAPALLTIYDVTGKVVRVYEINGVKGINNVTITKDEIETSGVLYYQLDSNDHTATKRMTKLK